ncbi:lysophospholipid acyltransferase family protein [Thermodesulfobacteriota bacterium]
MKVKLSSFLQSKFNVFLYQRLGWKICINYLLFMGGLYYLVKKKERDIISESVRQVFRHQKDENELKVITRNVFKGTLYHYFEKIFNAYENIDNLCKFYNKSISMDRSNILDDALKNGKGVMFVTGHYGAIEYIPIFLALKKYPISVVVKFATKQLEDSLYSKTKDIGLRIINANQDKNVLRTIIKELKQNRLVFIECDEIEEWKPSKKENMWFLGKRIGVDKTIDLIHRRTKAEVVFGLLHRINLQQYKLILQNYDGILSFFNNRNYSVGEAVLKYLEQYIYSFPQAWYQWKNYTHIENLNAFDRIPKGPTPTRLLEPAFGQF